METSGTEGRSSGGARDKDDLAALMRLNLVDALGPIGIGRLLEHFGSAEAVLSAGLSELLKVEGIGEKTAEAILNGASEEEAEKELERVRSIGARILTKSDAEYPSLLKTIYDPPVMLYVKGKLVERDALAVAIVGTRRASFYGLKQARSLAAGLAGLGFTIVSGMARGIDTAAHEGALQAGGRTIAVWGTGLGTVFPEENAELATRIIEHGAVLSEFPVEYPPLPQNFPRRNRIVSGMSMGVIMVEGSERSGGMITAAIAGEQGRSVFAVPGLIDDPKSRGPHKLLREGARLVASIDDVLEELGPLPVGVKTEDTGTIDWSQALALNEREKAVYAVLDSAPKGIDDVADLTGLSVGELAGTLTVLEMKQMVCKLAGARFVRKR